MIFLPFPVLSLQIVFGTMIGSFLNVFVGWLTKKTISRLVFLPPPKGGDSDPLFLPYPFLTTSTQKKIMERVGFSATGPGNLPFRLVYTRRIHWTGQGSADCAYDSK